MGTRIEEAITIISDIDKAYRTFTSEEIRALETALNVMRKYQKIQQILKSLDDGEINYPQMAYYLREVLEDGNNYI